MSSSREHYHMYPSVLVELENEREHQDHKWGGKEHDDEHSRSDWLDIIATVSQLARELPEGDHNQTRRKYIKIAALAIAAVESMYRTGKAY